MTKILLIDVDVDHADTVAYGLRRDGFTVLLAKDGLQGLRRWETEGPDLTIIDADLPRIDGFELCRRIRDQSDAPIILTSASERDDLIVRAFLAGTDDFISKPFSIRQLSLRIKALLRRVQTSRLQQQSNIVQVGDLTLDSESHEVLKGGSPVRLTPLEFRIMYMLALNAGRVVPTQRLVEFAWGNDADGPGMLKIHICHIRRKLGLRNGSPLQIKAVSGVGYSMSRPCVAAVS